MQQYLIIAACGIVLLGIIIVVVGAGRLRDISINLFKSFGLKAKLTDDGATIERSKSKKNIHAVNETGRGGAHISDSEAEGDITATTKLGENSKKS